MRLGFAAGMVLVLGLQVAACSSDGKTQSDGSGGTPGSDSGVTGGAPGAGGGSSGAGGSAVGTGGDSTGPAITSAPPAWVKPAECSGVGEKCEFLSCNGTALCQSLGDVCIPAAPSGMLLPGKSAERPYCLAYTCMTFDEASCFCTGAAAEQFPLCKSGPAAVAGLCGGTGASCTEDPCCDGLTCVKESPTRSSCQKPCQAAADCDTGCCADVSDTGTGPTVCALKTACDNPCKKRGEACDASGGNCCNANTCVTATNPLFSGCRPSCTTNADCDTNCCELFKDSTSGFCADAQWCTGCANDSECANGGCCIPFSDLGKSECVDAQYCTCGTEGTACSGDTGVLRCCEGTDCGGIPDQGAAIECRKTCHTATDCPTNCCSANVQGKDYGICLPQTLCQ